MNIAIAVNYSPGCSTAKINKGDFEKMLQKNFVNQI